jgi:two-component system cell cycle sensor histidine kinase/response regulator CckA
VRVRPEGDLTVWSVAEITQERERQENVFQELQHAIDYLDHAPAGFLSVDPGGSIVYLNATLAGWLGYDLAQVGAGGLALEDVLPRHALELMSGASGAPGEVRTENFDLDLRRRNGQFLPVRLYHRIAFGQDGKAGPSRTLVLSRSPGQDSEEAQRAAEVRFARFFNNTPIAIATVNRPGGAARERPSRALRTLPRAAGQEGRPVERVLETARRLEAACRPRPRGAANPPLELQVAGEGGARADVDQPRGRRGWEGESAILYAPRHHDLRQVEEPASPQAQKMNAVGQLAGGVAHDFNNVLQAIIGYCDLLLANHRPTDPSFPDIMQIKQNANRAASLGAQLPAFSRRRPCGRRS